MTRDKWWGMQEDLRIPPWSLVWVTRWTVMPPSQLERGQGKDRCF